MIKITIEELDIIVEASIKPALDEIKKIKPKVTEQVNKVLKEFNKLNIQDIQPKLNMKSVEKELQKTKKQIKEVFNPDEVSFTINGKNFDDYFTKIKGVRTELGRFTRVKTPSSNMNSASIKYDTNSIQNFINNYANAKTKASQLKQEIKQVENSQSKANNVVSRLKNKIQQANNSTKNLKNNFKQMPKIAQNITNHIKQIGTNTKSEIGKVLRYAGALLGLRSIYNVLRNSANSWLSSQNAGTQQLSANIEYMKYAMGSVFAPVIQFITDLIYKLMKAVQSLVYAFSGVNIFAKATANSMKSAAESANKTNKSLSNIHNEIYNVSENTQNEDKNPNIDLSKIDTSASNWFDKWKAKLSKFFAPLKNAWDNQGEKTIQKAKNAFNSLKDTASTIAKSWSNVWTNGTGQEIIEFVLQILQSIFDIIKNISDAWKNAWNTDDSGTELIQVICNVLKKLLDLIKTIVDKIKEFTSNPIVQEYFKNAIEMVKKFWNALGGILDFLTGVFTGDWEKAWNGLKTFVSNIFGLIGNAINEKFIMIKGIVTNSLDSIKNLWSNIWNGIKNFASNIWDGLLNKIDNIFPGMRNIIETNITNVKNKISEILNNIKTFWGNIWDGIKNKVSEVWNGIYNVIKNPINWILAGVEKMANGVVSGINKVISSLNKMQFKMPDWLGGGTFGINIPLANYVSLPRLAKGNVAYEPMIAQFGEYAGARSNPEITAPQNVMAETFRNEMSDFFASNNDNRPMNFIINVGNKKIGEILLDDLRDMKRRTGKDVEVLVGG